MEWVLVPVVALIAAAAMRMYPSYVKLKIEDRKQQVASLPADVHERLTRLEARLVEMSEEPRQLRSELEWQGGSCCSNPRRSDRPASPLGHHVERGSTAAPSSHASETGGVAARSKGRGRVAYCLAAPIVSPTG